MTMKTKARLLVAVVFGVLMPTYVNSAYGAESPYGGTPASIPGTLQAKNYDQGGQGTGYSVSSTNGTANNYRTDGIDLEISTDSGGGYNIGWTASGQWFRYTVNVATPGTYTVGFRVAAPTAVAGAFHLSNASGTNLSGAINIPQTGSWQTWTTVTATVTLAAGQQVLVVNEDNSGWNFNYATFAKAESAYGGNPQQIPGTIQAENYDQGGQGSGFNVASENGTANNYRPDGVDLETTTDSGGGYDVGWTAGGQWFRYTVNVATAGPYTVSFRVAAPNAVTGAFHLSNITGNSLSGPVNIPGTGGYQVWTNVTATVTLPAGLQVLIINQDNNGWNVDSAAFSSAIESAYGGTPATVPGTVQAENYDLGGQGIGYSVNSINGTSNSYRTDGVDLEMTGDSGGGYDLGWTAGKQWFNYTVNVATAGVFTVSFRVAATNAVADAFHISSASGANLTGSVSIPATGGYQSWTNVSATMTLPAGQQVLRFSQDNPGWNINYATFTSTGGAFAPRQLVLNFLTSISGNHTAIGVENKAGGVADSNQLANMAGNGQYPSFWSGDFGFGSAASPSSREAMIQVAEQQWTSGAIVQLIYHACPLAWGSNEQGCAWNTGSNPVDGSYNDLTETQWTDLTTPGGTLYGVWTARLDTLATYFQQLKDAGIAPLFRPFHEINGQWAWWQSHPGPNGSARLYQLTHDYLVNTKGLNNIIWVWNVQDYTTLASDVTTYTPGSNYFDIAALDVYNTGYTTGNYDAMISASNGKPIGVAECQFLPTPSLLASQPLWSYVAVWPDFLYSPYQTDNTTQIPELFNDSQILTLSKMPGW